MEQNDEEIEQLLGEIPRATSAPPHLDEYQRPGDNHIEGVQADSICPGQSVYQTYDGVPRTAAFNAFSFGLHNNNKHNRSGALHHQNNRKNSHVEPFLSEFADLTITDHGTMGFGREKNVRFLLPRELDPANFNPSPFYQNVAEPVGVRAPNSSAFAGPGDLYFAALQQQDKMASALQAQKQQVLILQLQLEEEKRRQRAIQQQYIFQQQVQDRAALYGLQSQALLAAAVAPMSSYRSPAGRHPLTRAGYHHRHSWMEANSQNQNQLEPVYGSQQPSTTFCRYYAQGYCSRGDLCSFLHVQVPGAGARASSKDIRFLTSSNGGEKISSFPERVLERGRAGTSAISRKNHSNGHICTNGIDHEVMDEEGMYTTLGQAQGLTIRQDYDHSPKYTSLKEVEGRIYSIAKDQHGCRFLQRKFEEGGQEELEKIFDEIIDHIVDLMTDPFGNYLVQKLLEVCSEAQRLEILRVVCSGDELVTISLNMHGTRAVQKLIETLKTPEHIVMITSSLKQGIVTLIKDLNGNHVVQRCLQRLESEDNQFIFDAAAQHCVDIATHRHGCCVLQRCVDFSRGVQKERLVAEIASNALVLSQDQYGNYVVQYILEDPVWVLEEVMARLEGNYAHLAMQKFSSNVVEKCLNKAADEGRAQIVHELITGPLLGQLLQDPFANYVIQCALTVTKLFQGVLHASLVEAIRPFLPALRSSPYGKRILARTNLKKS